MKTDSLYIFINAFEKLQIRHEQLMKEGIESLRDKKDDLPDLVEMTETRETAYSNLCSAFESITLAEEETVNLEELKLRISSVLEREDSLKSLVEEYRDGLRNSISRLQHGKKAIKGYGGAF